MATTTTTITMLFVVHRCVFGVLFSHLSKDFSFKIVFWDINIEIQRIVLGAPLKMSSGVDAHYHHHVVCYIAY